MEALLSSRDMRPSNSRDRRSEAVLGSSEKTLARREGQGLACVFSGWYGLQLCSQTVNTVNTAVNKAHMIEAAFSLGWTSCD